MYDMVIKNARLLHEAEVVNIGVSNGSFVHITKGLVDGKKVIDVKGGIAIPPFVELHTHFDTALTAGWPNFNQTGTLQEGISIWNKRKKSLTMKDVNERTEQALKMYIKHGVLSVRAAVDISDDDLTALKAILQLKKGYDQIIDLQIIAFPQDGLMKCFENQERMQKALEIGADAVSAVPHLERSREEGVHSLEYCFRLAKEYGSYIHIFCDEVDEVSSTFVQEVANLTIENGFEGRVAVSHVNALAYYESKYAESVMEAMKKARLTVVSCPLINSSMLGRNDAYPKATGITRVKELDAKNVNICIAHDDIQTPFYPFGDGNMLKAAFMGAHLAHMTGEEQMKRVLSMITERPAAAFGKGKAYGIQQESEANFLLFEERTIRELMLNQSVPRYVIKRGEVIAETIPAYTKWGCSL